MVKNTSGKSKVKGFANKNSSESRDNFGLRISKDSCELYAQVTKTLGNGMCHVLCCDGKTRLCHIRGKFRGRHKKDNFVGLGMWLLIGLREWSSSDRLKKKLDNCDLLEVYNDRDKIKLKTTVNINWDAFIVNDNVNTNNVNEDELIFQDEKTDEYNKIMDAEFSEILMKEVTRLISTDIVDNNQGTLDEDDLLVIQMNIVQDNIIEDEFIDIDDI